LSTVCLEINSEVLFNGKTIFNQKINKNGRHYQLQKYKKILKNESLKNPGQKKLIQLCFDLHKELNN